jgi:hypothetical protein
MRNHDIWKNNKTASLTALTIVVLITSMFIVLSFTEGWNLSLEEIINPGAPHCPHYTAGKPHSHSCKGDLALCCKIGN